MSNFVSQGTPCYRRFNPSVFWPNSPPVSVSSFLCTLVVCKHCTGVCTKANQPDQHQFCHLSQMSLYRGNKMLRSAGLNTIAWQNSPMSLSSAPHWHTMSFYFIIAHNVAHILSTTLIATQEGNMHILISIINSPFHNDRFWDISQRNLCFIYIFVSAISVCGISDSEGVALPGAGVEQ